MIFEIKPPFNLRLEPEFSFSDPVGEPGGTRFEERVPQPKKCPLEAFRRVGEPGGTRLEQRCPVFCAIPLGIGELDRTFVEHHDKVIGYICNHSKPALFIINPTPDEIIETLKTQPQYIL